MRWKQSVLCEVHMRHVPHRVHVPFKDRFDGTVPFLPLDDSQFLKSFFGWTPKSGLPGCHHHARKRGAVQEGTSERITLGTSDAAKRTPLRTSLGSPKGAAISTSGWRHWGHRSSWRPNFHLITFAPVEFFKFQRIVEVSIRHRALVPDTCLSLD